MNHLKLTLGFLSLVFLNPLQSQEPLRQKYENMIETSETYDQYKVIPRTTIDAFWAEVSDTLRQNKARMKQLSIALNQQQTSAAELNERVIELQTSLNANLNQKDSIEFMGITFSKLSYHIMVWSIILILAIVAVLAYLMFLRSNKVTTRVKQAHESLAAEFDDHRNSAREKQAKLKRELQTAINQLNERR